MSLTIGDLLDATDKVNFILTSTHHHLDNKHARERLIESIIRSGKINPINCIENSPHYKLAFILKEPNLTFKTFSKKVRIVLKNPNPRSVLNLGNLEWKLPFELPDKRMYKDKKKHLVHKEALRITLHGNSYADILSQSIQCIIREEVKRLFTEKKIEEIKS